MIEQIILKILHSQLKVEEAVLKDLKDLESRQDITNLFHTNLMIVMVLSKMQELKRQIRELEK